MSTETFNLVNFNPAVGYEAGFKLGGYSNNGYSVSNVGDVDKDGIDDYISASPLNYAFLVYGTKLGYPSGITFTTSGELGVYTTIYQTITLFYQANAAGDVNRDGFKDIIIGGVGGYSPAFYPTGYGPAFLIYGSENINKTLKIQLTSSGESGVFSYITGSSSSSTSSPTSGIVSGIGDINTDGIDDFALGNAYYGFSTIIYGNYSLPLIINIYYLNTESIYGIHLTASSLGTNICPTGDINNDGINDAIFSGNDNAYILFGNSSLPPSISFSNSGKASQYSAIQLPNTGTGGDGVTPAVICSSAGDFNNDGFGDYILASPFNNQGYGTANLFFGMKSYPLTLSTSTLSMPYGIVIEGINKCYLGHSLANIGDFNHDNISDIMIGSNCIPGLSYIIYGNSSLTSINLYNFTGITIEGSSNAGLHAGFSVGGGGDYNNDGTPDVLIGAPFDSSETSSSSSSIVYVLYGSASGIATSAPTYIPTPKPTTFPSSQPTSFPSEQPISIPSSQPSKQPTSQPSGQPSMQPSEQPTAQPSVQPSNQPSMQPSVQPSEQPTSYPTAQPTNEGVGTGNHELNIGAIAGETIGGVLLLVLGYCAYARTNHFWPFIVSSTTSVVNDIELKAVDVVSAAVTNPVIGETLATGAEHIA